MFALVYCVLAWCQADGDDGGYDGGAAQTGKPFVIFTGPNVMPCVNKAMSGCTPTLTGQEEPFARLTAPTSGLPLLPKL